MNRFLLCFCIFCSACGGSDETTATPPADSGSDGKTDGVATDSGTGDATSADSAPTDSAVDTGSADSSGGDGTTDTADTSKDSGAGDTGGGDVGEGGDCKVSTDCAKGLACCKSSGAITAPLKCIKPDPDGTCPKFP